MKQADHGEWGKISSKITKGLNLLTVPQANMGQNENIKSKYANK